MKEKKPDKRGGARPGAGRPTKSKPAHLVTLRIPDDMYRIMQTWMEFYNETQTELILKSIKNQLIKQFDDLDQEEDSSERRG